MSETSSPLTASTNSMSKLSKNSKLPSRLFYRIALWDWWPKFSGTEETRVLGMQLNHEKGKKRNQQYPKSFVTSSPNSKLIVWPLLWLYLSGRLHLDAVRSVFRRPKKARANKIEHAVTRSGEGLSFYAGPMVIRRRQRWQSWSFDKIVD